MTEAEIAPPQKVDDLGRKNLLGNRNEKGRAEPAAWNINHLRRFMHPETEHQALYSHFFGDGSRSVLWGGYLGISHIYYCLRDNGVHAPGHKSANCPNSR